LTGRHITGLGFLFVVLLTLALVLAWGDSLSFPKLLDKEVPTQLVSVGAELQGGLEEG